MLRLKPGLDCGEAESPHGLKMPSVCSGILCLTCLYVSTLRVHRLQHLPCLGISVLEGLWERSSGWAPGSCWSLGPQPAVESAWTSAAHNCKGEGTGSLPEEEMCFCPEALPDPDERLLWPSFLRCQPAWPLPSTLLPLNIPALCLRVPRTCFREDLLAL